MRDNQCEIMYGAVHEAGHVVVSMHYGMPVFGFRVMEDGRGEVRGGGHPSLDLDKMTDAWLAGPAAEGMFRNQDQCPDLSHVEFVLGTIELGDEVDDPDDYHMAVDLISRREPEWDAQRIAAYLCRSYERCTRVLREDWSRVLAMANRAAEAPGEYVDPEDFD